MTIRRYIVRGRSIDGTVYARPFSSRGVSWLHAMRAASPVTLRHAQMIIDDTRAANARRGIDEQIGHLVAIPAARSLREYAARQRPLFEAAGAARVHTFDDTGDAYDATQCRDEIATGDALLIERESVVGLAWAWPIAVTTAAGEFHTVDDKPDSLAVIMADSKITAGQIRAAVALARERGFPVRPEFAAVADEAGQ